MALGADGVTQGVAGFVEEVFNKAGPRILDDTGEILRDGIPFGGYIIPAIGVEIGRRACRRYADNSGLFDPATAADFERLCRPYLDDVGYGDNPSIDLPFRGGQCYGAIYRVVTAWSSPPLGAQTNEQEVGARVVGTYRGEKQPNQTTPVGIELQASPGGPVTRLSITSLADEFLGSFSIASITRIDGGSDDCGNPPPIVVDPVPPPVPDPPGPRPFNPSPEIDIDIDVEIDIDPVVGPVIIFDIGTGPITIDPFPEGGDDGGGGDGGGGDGPPPGDVGEPAPPEDTGDDGTASGCAPDGSVLAGLKVNILEPLPQVSQFDDQVWRGACYVYMGVPSNLALHPEGVALRDGQFFLPQVENLTCYEVRANTGFNLRVTPYYRALESDES